MSIVIDTLVMELDARCKKLEQRYDWLMQEVTALRVEYDSLCTRLSEQRRVEKRPANGRA